MSDEMINAMALALAKIDDALGLPQDGCNDPERTLMAITALREAAEANGALNAVRSLLSEHTQSNVDRMSLEELRNELGYLLSDLRDLEPPLWALRGSTAPLAAPRVAADDAEDCNIAPGPWIHLKSGEVYRVLKTVRLRDTNGWGWGIQYAASSGSEYIRTSADFLRAFQPLKNARRADGMVLVPPNLTWLQTGGVVHKLMIASMRERRSGRSIHEAFMGDVGWPPAWLADVIKNQWGVPEYSALAAALYRAMIEAELELLHDA